MKILHLEAGRHFYGGARQAGYLIDGLAERGCLNLLVCNPGHALARRSNAEVVEMALGGDVDFSLSRRLAAVLDTHRPDIVHVHSRRGADTFGGRAAQAAGIPAILTRRVQSAEPGFWLRAKCRPYAAVVAISTAVRDQLARAGIGADRLTLIPSAVATDAFRPDAAARSRLIERFDLPQDALIAGAAAQLIRRKGLKYLIPLMARLTESEPTMRLLVFGQGPGRAALERAVVRSGMQRRVLLTGFRDDWPALVPGLDVFLHPARREGLGAAVLEAMSAGVPVIASAIGGIVDAIDNGVDGFLVSEDDEWLDALERLLADSALRKRIGRAARRKVESRFTIAGMTDAYVSLYEATLARDV